MTFDEWQKEAYKRQLKNRELYGYQVAADIWIKEYNEAVEKGDEKARRSFEKV